MVTLIESTIARARGIWTSIDQRRVGSTAVASLFSKILAALMQVLIVPIAVASIGQRAFGAFLVISSVSFWITSTSVGIGNTLTNEAAAGRIERKSAVPLVGTVLGVLQAFVISIACYLLIANSLPSMIGTADLKLLNEARVACVVLVVVSGVQLAIQPLQGMQLGMLQGNILFAFQSVANLSVIIALLCMRFIPHPSLLMFCVLVSLLPLIVGLVNVGQFCMSAITEFYWPNRAEFFRVARRLYANGLSFFFINWATYGVIYGSTVFLAWMTGGKKFIAFSIYNRVIFFLIYFVWLIAMPLWPALVQARISNDERWVSRALRTCFLLFSGLALALCVIVSLFGRQLIALWVGANLGQTWFFAVVFAIYYVLVIWREFLITVLIAFERVEKIAFVQLAQTVVAYTLAYLLIPRYGEIGMAMAMVIGIASTSAWLLPMTIVLSPSGAKRAVASYFVRPGPKIAGLTSPVNN